jgi:predicted transcriptional regulator
MGRKLSISISDELDSALVLATVKRHESKSQVIETLLRENPAVQRFVDIVRADPETGIYAGAQMMNAGRTRAEHAIAAPVRRETTRRVVATMH